MYNCTYLSVVTFDRQVRVRSMVRSYLCSLSQTSTYPSPPPPPTPTTPTPHYNPPQPTPSHPVTPQLKSNTHTPHHSPLISHYSSLITHPSSLIPYHSSLITLPSSLITHPSPLITHPSSLTLHRDNEKVLETVLVCSYGAQVEHFKQTKLPKKLVTQPL